MTSKKKTGTKVAAVLRLSSRATLLGVSRAPTVAPSATVQREVTPEIEYYNLGVMAFASAASGGER